MDKINGKPDSNSNLLCAGLCLKCQHQSYKSDENLQKIGRCMKKFWMDKPDKLNPKNPINNCKLFKPL
jgi:hypothetical protein